MEAAHDPGARTQVPSGRRYRVTGQLEAVTPVLAAELVRVLERFAAEAGFDGARPVSIEFRPGVVGHHQVGRASDIYGVGGIGIGAWKRRWDEVLAELRQMPQPLAASRLERERNRNLGWRLYKALQHHGRWSQPYGYPIQLFGPWTRSEGPWKPISDRLLRAHGDHIHVAK